MGMISYIYNTISVLWNMHVVSKTAIFLWKCNVRGVLSLSSHEIHIEINHDVYYFVMQSTRNALEFPIAVLLRPNPIHLTHSRWRSVGQINQISFDFVPISGVILEKEREWFFYINLLSVVGEYKDACFCPYLTLLRWYEVQVWIEKVDPLVYPLRLIYLITFI